VRDAEGIVESLFDWAVWIQNDSNLRLLLRLPLIIILSILVLRLFSQRGVVLSKKGRLPEVLTDRDSYPLARHLALRATGIFLAMVGLFLSLLLLQPLKYSTALSPILPVRSYAESKSALVFVHGWNGDEATWKTFPKLFAADEAFAGFDILLINYPTYMGRRNLTIPQLADWISWNIDNALPGKDIYIVAHSMGGVISRKMLLQRKLNQNADRVRSIVSIASPYNGANYARLASILGVSQELTRDLAKGSGVLEDIKIGWRDFKRHREASEARSICLASSQDAVVPPDSATDQCDDFLTYPRWDHSEIVRPESATDERYAIPEGMLKRTLAAMR
jgi:pimeloyl-ACP methyl ester carboxylesterase